MDTDSFQALLVPVEDDMRQLEQDTRSVAGQVRDTDVDTYYLCKTRHKPDLINPFCQSAYLMRAVDAGTHCLHRTGGYEIDLRFRSELLPALVLPLPYCAHHTHALTCGDADLAVDDPKELRYMDP